MEEDLHSDRQWLSVRSGREGNLAESKGRDGLGVPGPLAGAAPGTWRAGLAYAARYLGDTALAAEIVESVVHSAAKAHRNKPIKNPDSYVLSGIVRRVKKLLAREKRIEYRGSPEELERLKQGSAEFRISETLRFLGFWVLGSGWRL